MTIGTSTGEVYEDSVDHILDNPNKRVSDSFSDLKTEIPVTNSLAPELAGAKAAEYIGWAAAQGTKYAPAMNAVAWPYSAISTMIGMHNMRTGIINDVKEQLRAGKDINDVEFKKGSPADGFGLFSHMRDKFQVGPSVEEDSRTPEVKSFGEVLSYMSKIADPDKFKAALDTMPLSTNIEDRRGDPPQPLVQRYKPLGDLEKEQLEKMRKEREMGKGGPL